MLNCNTTTSVLMKSFEIHILLQNDSKPSTSMIQLNNGNLISTLIITWLGILIEMPSTVTGESPGNWLWPEFVDHRPY